MIVPRTTSNTQKAWSFLGLLAFGVLFFAPMSVSAQSSRDTNNRLNRIENEIETLNRAVYRGEAPPPVSSIGSDPAARAGAEVRLQQLEIELRDIRGKIEEQSYQIRQLTQKLDRALGDLELRVGDVENDRGASNVAPGTSAANYAPRYVAGGAKFTPPSSPQVSAPVPVGDKFTWSSNPAYTARAAGGQLGTISSGGDLAASAYESAFALLKNANYEAAGQGFDGFIKENPNHALVGNAKYWLGETYYVRGSYADAARIFAEGYQQFPKGAKAADNLLKLGMSLGAIGNTSDACIAFTQLKKDFPTGSSPVLRRAEQEMTSLNCT